MLVLVLCHTSDASVRRPRRFMSYGGFGNRLGKKSPTPGTKQMGSINGDMEEPLLS